METGDFLKRLRGILIGKPRDPLEKGALHKVSLIAVLAWIGLGADGLSSACYGPAEAFHALGDYFRLSIFLVFLTMVTIFLLSKSQMRVVQLFPAGGGGYLAASKLLGPIAGLLSGSALLVDYFLTIAVSIAACSDAVFSFLPVDLHDPQLKMGFSLGILMILTVLNLRGLRESVAVLTPFFFLFLITHVVALLYGTVSHLNDFPVVVDQVTTDARSGLAELGLLGLLALVIKAYTLGGGTYTGIEAIANSVQTFRQPRIETARRTLVYMGISLAIVAGGLLFCYLLFEVRETEGKTLNAVFFEAIVRDSGLPPGLGTTCIGIALFSEAALLFVAAQAGIVSGPRVLASMALDYWMPRRFANLSDRLVTSQGIMLFATVAAACLALSGGSVRLLVVMYSINVFLTFTLSQLGLLLHDWKRIREPGAWRDLFWIVLAFLVSSSLLVATVVFKFAEGGWVTLVVTGAVAILGFGIRGHYRQTRRALADLNLILKQSRPERTDVPNPNFDPSARTAALLVSGFSGLGIHSFLSIHRLFPNYYRNFYFLTVGTIGVSEFKSEEDIEQLRDATKGGLQLYVAMARSEGFFAEGRWSLGADKVDELVLHCKDLAREIPDVVFFLGRLVFQRENFLTWTLHNHTAEYLQRRLQFEGLQSVILPIRVRWLRQRKRDDKTRIVHRGSEIRHTEESS